MINQPNNSDTITKIIKLTTTPIKENNLEYYLCIDGKIKFYYYDLSNIYDKLNYKKVYSLYKNIFQCDKQFSEDNLNFEIEDVNKYELLYELGIFNKETINFEDLNHFYNKNGHVQTFLSNTNDSEILNKFNKYLKTKTSDLDEIFKIKQIVGIEEKIEEYNSIFSKINQIYEKYEIIYICVACGPHTKIPDFFITKVANMKKTAVIYISELATTFTPFWLKIETSGNLYVSENNMYDKFKHISSILTNNLDIFIFEYRIPHKLDFFFNRLNCSITKKTLFYLGFDSCGVITTTHLSTFLKNISENPNVAFYLCGHPPKIHLYEEITDFLLLNSYPKKLSDKIVDFLMTPTNSSIDAYKLKYIKYKNKYFNLKKLSTH